MARARQALLDFLADRLARPERRATVVVFDGRQAPPGLEKVFFHREIMVRFARSNQEADDVIEELIGQHTSPKRLTVVSSDHRLHRAARRRRAMPIDSEPWFRRFAGRPVLSQESVRVPAEIPADSDAEVDQRELEHWLRQFGGAPKSQEAPPASSHPDEEPSPESDLSNPFPPGYAEDLLRGEDL